MPHRILTDITASISELKSDPMKVVASGEGMPVAVLNRNKVYDVALARYGGKND